MRKTVAIGVLVFAALSVRRASAQTPLPRAGWVATASTSGSSDTPSRAIDGSPGSRFTTGTDQNPGQWFSIDMQTPQAFSQITIDPAGSTNDYTVAYQVFVSNDAVSWGLPVASGTGSPGVLTIIFPTQNARFVGVVQTGTGSHWWSIGEINVYGPGALPSVLLSASGWVATASVTGGSDAPSRAIDGSTSTRWTTGTAQTSGQWFQVDMRQSQSLLKVTMNSDGSSSDYARGYQIFVSDSPTTWGTAAASGTGSSSLISATFSLATGRYLTIVQTGSASNWWSLAEVQVYGVGSFAPVATVLPRTGWTATASSSGSSDVPANALDDNASTRWSTGSNQTSGMFFQVDMQTPQSVAKVTMDTTGSSNDYPRAYALYLASDTSNWGSPVATGTGTSSVVTIEFTARTARYLKIVLTQGTSSNWWSIHELNVYGTSPNMLLRDAWLTTDFASSTTGANALDGKLSTRWTTGAQQAIGQWYQIDMLAPQGFDQVILNAGAGSSDYPRGYALYASNDPTALGDPIATGDGTAPMVSISFQPRFARYIRISLTRPGPNWWSIAELNISLMPAASCRGADGSMAPDWTPCNDGDLCNRAKSCRAGVCVGGQNVCEDGDPCTADLCDASNGVCQHAPLGPDICASRLGGGVQLPGRVSFIAESDNNRCVPDAKHTLNRLNQRGEVMGWHWKAAGYPHSFPDILDDTFWHLQSMVRMPSFGPTSPLDGSIFFSLASNPSDPIFGVAKMGFSSGRGGRMLGGNRELFGQSDWHVHPNPADSFLTSALRRGVSWTTSTWGFNPQQNHPGGVSALGTHVVIPVQQFFFINDCIPFYGCVAQGVPFTSRPWVYVADLSDPTAPRLVSGLLTATPDSVPQSQIPALIDQVRADPSILRSNQNVERALVGFLSDGGTLPDDVKARVTLEAFFVGGGGVGNDATAITKLADGRFLLAVFKDGPARMEFYLSTSTDLEHVEGPPNQVPIGPFGTQGRAPDVVLPWYDEYNFTSFNFLTDCSGELFMLGMRGKVNGDEDWVDIRHLQVFQGSLPAELTGNVVQHGASQACGSNLCIAMTFPGCERASIDPGCIPDPALATAPAGSSSATEAPVWDKHMYCSDNDNEDECDFNASAGSYVDPDGKVIVYGTYWDDDGNAESGHVPGGGAALDGYVRGMEFHDQHGTFGAANDCPTMDSAWVELYQNSGFNRPTPTQDGDGRYYISQFARSGDRDDGHFANQLFNDYASSARWCIPEGSSAILWYGEPNTSSRFVLNGTGHVAAINSFAGLTFSDGHPLDENVSGLGWAVGSTDLVNGTRGTPDLRD